MTTWFLSFNLFIWCITLTDLCRVKNPCMPGINQRYHGVWIFKFVAVFCSLKFCWGFLHLCSSVILSSISSISISSVTQLCLTLCNTMDCSMPGFSVHQQLPELTQTDVHQVRDPTNHLIHCHPLLLLPSAFPRKDFDAGKDWRQGEKGMTEDETVGWLVILFFCVVFVWVWNQGDDGLIECVWKCSFLWNFFESFFMVQLSHPNETSGKTIALTRWTFVSK